MKQQEDMMPRTLAEELRGIAMSSDATRAKAVVDKLSPRMKAAAVAGQTAIWVDSLDALEVKALKAQGFGVVPPPSDDMRGTCSKQWQVWW